MKQIYIILLLLGMTLCGCSEGNTPSIGEGKYISSANDGWIVVADMHLYFHLKIEGKSSDLYWDMKYNYSIQPDSRIHLSPLVSSDYITGIARFDWFWNEENGTIVRKDSKNRNTCIYRISNKDYTDQP